MCKKSLLSQTHNLKKTTKIIEYLAGAQKNHAEQKVVFNTNEDR